MSYNLAKFEPFAVVGLDTSDNSGICIVDPTRPPQRQCDAFKKECGNKHGMSLRECVSRACFSDNSVKIGCIKQIMSEIINKSS